MDILFTSMKGEEPLTTIGNFDVLYKQNMCVQYIHTLQGFFQEIRWGEITHEEYVGGKSKTL